VRNSVKGLTTKDQVDNVPSHSFIHLVGHLVIKGDQVGQAGHAFHEPMLAGPDPLVVLHMPGERTQDEWFRNLNWHRRQADRPVVPEILLPSFLSMGVTQAILQSSGTSPVSQDC